MSKISDRFRALPNFYSLSGATEENVINAEQNLGVIFANDYKEYIMSFGVVSANGHEFTGICNAKRLNVVDVTIEERERNHNVPDDFYVIEQTHIDSIVIWQSSTGEIYQSQFNGKPVKIYNSLCEYIENKDDI